MNPPSAPRATTSIRPWLIALALWLALAAVAAVALWHLRRDAVNVQARELDLLSLALTDEIDCGLRGAEEGLHALRAERSEGHLAVTGALESLERAHVLSQSDFGPHLKVHLRMLHVGFTSHDWREVRGQVLRITLVPVGHLLGRLPRGNTGGENVSAFAPMAIAPDIERLLNNKES